MLLHKTASNKLLIGETCLTLRSSGITPQPIMGQFLVVLRYVSVVDFALGRYPLAW